MSWMIDLADPAAVRERTLKSLSVPVGMANPLWLAFGAAAGAGAAWWLMTRWATPFNAQSVFGAAIYKPAGKLADRTPETTPVMLEVALETAPAIAEAVAATVEAAEAAAEETLELVLEAARDTVEAEAAAVEEFLAEAEEEFHDDLTLLVGVGPRSAAALAERGVTRFAHLAAWTDEEMAAFDAEMKLKGRSLRDQWRAQAKRLAAQN
jgi:predicted flap endonuclease-1-like 5' DNA nuclease